MHSQTNRVFSFCFHKNGKSAFPKEAAETKGEKIMEMYVKECN